MSTRRDFLRSSAAVLGTFVASAGAPFSPAFAARRLGDLLGARRYPFSVASGDPLPDGIVLWTRAEPSLGEADIPLTLHLSTQRDFKTVAVEKRVTALADADHTVRVVVMGLEPATIYYYRFVDETHLSSPVGRTRTAPDPSAKVAARFALASCQNFQTGYYHAYRYLLQREEQGGAKNNIDFVLFVGDFIYELIFPADKTSAARSRCNMPRRSTNTAIFIAACWPTRGWPRRGRTGRSSTSSTITRWPTIIGSR